MRTTLQILALLVLLAGSYFLMDFDRTAETMETPGEVTVVAAPADLAEHRKEFLAGITAVQRQQADTAIELLSSFSFAPREVEQYRLHSLADAYHLAGEPVMARDTLARLWRRGATLVRRAEVGTNLGWLYSSAGHFKQAAGVYEQLAASGAEPPVRATAQTNFILEKFRQGDPAAMLFGLRTLYVETPQAAQADAGADVVRSLLGLSQGSAIPLTFQERLRRAENLIRDGKPEKALDELRVLELSARAASPRLQVRLLRGIAHHRLRQFQESDRALEPVFNSYFKFAEPALLHSARNNRILAASIDPFVTRTVTQRQRSGTRRVRVKGKLVNRPVYKNVKKTVKLPDLAKRKRKEELERRGVERLKDVLLIRSSAEARKEALSTLLTIAQAKKQTAYMQELAAQLEDLDPASEPALQYFWDLAWTAYQKKDAAASREMLSWISSTYSNPNIQRQASYWLARVLERSGEPERARQIYQELINAPYHDLYALHAKRKGAIAQKKVFPDPFAGETREWAELADAAMPRELRLAYELTALGANREARLEIQKNASDRNRKYADAILADLHYNEGAMILAHRYIRRAFPEIATVRQDEVPPHFLRLYYPLKYEEIIREAAEEQKLDPYLVMALIHQESAFTPTVRSRVGATGLMQLMPATARELSNRLYAAFAESRLENPEVNIELGTHYLRSLIREVGGTVELALAAYNAGPGNVRKWRRENPRKPLDEFIESIPYDETRGYVKRITLLRSSYERLHDDLSSGSQISDLGSRISVASK